MRRIRLNLRAVLAICLLTNVSGCAFFSLKNWFDAEGTVKYRDINKPTPNVHIAAVWRGMNTENENAFECYHVYATKTDNEGKFTVRGWREYFTYGHLKEKKMSIIMYKPGFWDKELLHELSRNKDTTTFYIEAASDKNRQTYPTERLKFLQKLVGLTSCDIKNPSRSQLKPMFDDILDEAEGLAKTDIDKKILASIKTWTNFVSGIQEKKSEPQQAKKQKQKKSQAKKSDKKSENADGEKKKVKLTIIKPKMGKF